ncbi:MAG: XylR family transcriptional regulator [Planctomycetota bacterium]
MSRQIRKRRVALAVTGRSTHEDETVRGALAYHSDIGRWQLVTGNLRPFVPARELDLSAVDGVISTFNSRSWAEEVIQAGVPAVNTSSAIADLPMACVVNDDEAIGRLGGQYLLERGFEHYGFLTVGNSLFGERRIAGFKRMVEGNAGRVCHVSRGFTSDDWGRPERLAEWLKGLPKPIAIMAENDTWGCQLIDAAASIGLSVPEDVAVLGVDDDEWLTIVCATPMSSIATNAKEIGYRAAQLLDRLMSGSPLPDKPQLIPPKKVVARKSTDVVISDDRMVTNALRFIREHCAEIVTVEDVLDEIGVSRKTLELRMKRVTGQTPRNAIFRARIEKSKRMLSNSSTPVGEIARICGFRQSNHFNTVFKRLTGMTPGEYRQRQIASV